MKIRVFVPLKDCPIDYYSLCQITSFTAKGNKVFYNFNQTVTVFDCGNFVSDLWTIKELEKRVKLKEVRELKPEEIVLL